MSDTFITMSPLLASGGEDIKWKQMLSIYNGLYDVNVIFKWHNISIRSLKLWIITLIMYITLKSHVNGWQTKQRCGPNLHQDISHTTHTSVLLSVHVMTHTFHGLISLINMSLECHKYAIHIRVLNELDNFIVKRFMVTKCQDHLEHG